MPKSTTATGCRAMTAERVAVPVELAKRTTAFSPKRPVSAISASMASWRSLAKVLSGRRTAMMSLRPLLSERPAIDGRYSSSLGACSTRWRVASGNRSSSPLRMRLTVESSPADPGGVPGPDRLHEPGQDRRRHHHRIAPIRRHS